MWWKLVLIFFGILLATALLFAFSYHRRFKVKQPLLIFLFRYFIGDYFIFPIKWCPGILGIGLRYLVYRILFKRMGSNVTILEGAHFINPGEIEIGSNSGIGYECFFEATGPIKIGDWVRFGPRVSMFTTNHKFDRKDALIKHQGYEVGAIEVGNDVWFGANVMVLSNVRIGTGAVIGASSVVVEDIPEYAIAVGNPARIIRYRQ